MSADNGRAEPGTCGRTCYETTSLVDLQRKPYYNVGYSGAKFEYGQGKSTTTLIYLPWFIY